MSEKLMAILLLNIPGLIIFGLPALYKYNSRKPLKKKLFILETISRVADIRRRLFELVLKKKISPDSLTFRFFYGVTSDILRHPDHFEHIAFYCLRGVSKPAIENETSILLTHESAGWPKEMRSLLIELADVLHCMADWRFFEVVANHKIKLTWAVINITKDTIWRHLSNASREAISSKVYKPVRNIIEYEKSKEKTTQALLARSAAIRSMATAA